MTDIATASGASRLTPSELEQLHIRLATAASLNDPNILTESVISDILSGREDPVPLYTTEFESTETDNAIRQQIANRDGKLWDAVFNTIEQGQIDTLDHFIKLGFDINSPHPWRRTYALYIAVKTSQTNMMRHLINLDADVNSWSAIPNTDGKWESNTRYLSERARTPLMCASGQGSLNICKILCETAFADPMLIAPDGQTAQRLAAKNGHKEIVEYLPAHRGGAWLRLKYDYNHRWRYINKACKGIYWFCRILLYEVPKFFLITIPWELSKSAKREMVRLYRDIPNIREWPRIAADACISTLRGIKHFFIELGKVIKATPRAVYDGGKYIVKKAWRGIKAIPGLVARGARKTINGIKMAASWLQDLILSIVSAIHTLISAIADFFRSITLADIINGFTKVLQAIFVDFPQLVWTGLKALGRGISQTLDFLFGAVYWIVYYIIYGLLFIILYVPKRIGRIIGSIAGGIAKAFRELWIFISPKSMG